MNNIEISSLPAIFFIPASPNVSLDPVPKTMRVTDIACIYIGRFAISATIKQITALFKRIFGDQFKVYDVNFQTNRYSDSLRADAFVLIDAREQSRACCLHRAIHVHTEAAARDSLYKPNELVVRMSKGGPFVCEMARIQPSEYQLGLLKIKRPVPYARDIADDVAALLAEDH